MTISQKVSFKDFVLLTMPFAKTLLAWCDKQEEFKDALKVLYSDRFLHLGAISIHQSRFYPKDEIIGFYAYAYMLENPIFKQDFIINVGNAHEVYVLHTTNPYGNSKYVKGIGEMKDKKFFKLHHLAYDELPEDPELKRRAVNMIAKGEEIRWSGGFNEPSQEKLEEMYTTAIKLRKNNDS